MITLRQFSTILITISFLFASGEKSVQQTEIIPTSDQQINTKHLSQLRLEKDAQKDVMRQLLKTSAKSNPEKSQSQMLQSVKNVIPKTPFKSFEKPNVKHLKADDYLKNDNVYSNFRHENRPPAELRIESYSRDASFIEGIVRDFDGNPMSGVTVYCELWETEESDSSVTNENGYYHISTDQSDVFYWLYIEQDEYWYDESSVWVESDGSQFDFHLGETSSTASIWISYTDEEGNEVPFVETNSPESPQISFATPDGLDAMTVWPSDMVHISGWSEEYGHADVTLEGVEAGQNYDIEIMFSDSTGPGFEFTDFEVTLNGGSSADIEAGESVTVTLTFDSHGEGPFAGLLSLFYDANFNDTLEPQQDINLMHLMDGVPAIWLVDNMDDDENLEVGVYEITLSVDDENDDFFWLMLQNTSLLFTSFNPETNTFGDNPAILNVGGFESDYSISGGTNPETSNMFVIVFSEGDDESGFFLTMTQEDGSFHVDVSDGGEYVLFMVSEFGINQNLYADPFAQMANVEGEETGFIFDIYEYTTLVHGHVWNPEGEPVHGADISFEYFDDTGEGYWTNSTTNPDGYYECWVNGGLDYDVYVWAEGYNEWIDDVHIDYVDDFEFNIQLDYHGGGEHGYLEGVVWSAAGDPYPIPNAWVSAYNNYDGDYFDAETDENGHYWMEVPAGNYEMEAFAEGFSTEWVNVDVYPNEATFVDFYLYPEWEASISGVVMDVNGERLAGARIEARNLDGDGWSKSTFTDDMGMFELNLPGGVYDVAAGAEGYFRSWQYGVEVWDEGTWLDFTLSPVENFVGSMSGFVGFSGGDENQWRFIAVINDQYEAFRFSEDGHYEIPLVNGVYDFFAGAEGYEDIYIPSAVVIENNDIIFDITLFQEGMAHPPHIEWFGDVPEDQGLQMRLVWNPGNPGDWESFTGYSIWRKVNDAPIELWDFVATVPWHGMQPYSMVVPTLGNATPMDTVWSTFMVSAHTWDPNYFLDSEPVTGFSVDNIHPGAPGGVGAVGNDDGVLISWNRSHAPDFDYHKIYRHDIGSGEPATVFTTIDTFYVDGVGLGNYEYWVTTMDYNGNESEASDIVTIMLSTNDGSSIPTHFALKQNYPNPFNPSTQIQYALPNDANVSVTIYDVIGRQVRSLVQEDKSAGYHTALWNATNDLGFPVSAGVYIYSIQAGDYRAVKKMILMK